MDAETGVTESESESYKSHDETCTIKLHLIIFFIFYIVAKAIKETSTKEDSMSEATVTIGNYNSFTV